MCRLPDKAVKHAWHTSQHFCVVRVDAHQCGRRGARNSCLMSNVHPLPDKWLLVSIAQPDTDLEVGVMDKRGDVVALVFPVRRSGTDWVDAATKERIGIAPTHWRKWTERTRV
jgi:hypothetical protein